MGLLRDWEPIVNIIRKGGGSYGELFFGTVSALFVVSDESLDWS